MRRIYYLMESFDAVDKVSDTLHENGIADWQFHVLAKDEAGLYKHHLHRANFLQKKDVVHSGEQGMIVGAAVGLYLSFFIYPWSVSTTVMFGVIAAFVCVGAFAGSLIGNWHENYKIARFHDDIEQGKLLIMLDVKKDHHKLVMHLMQTEFPNLKPAGTDAFFSNPFKGEWIKI